ncbi:hypothetical protein, variant [Verruconis gallopava]|uniref:Uncharacterized protein n=1 Tax=Verruconis gallopava TaxID=253628 RepID=A0A0D2B8B1_9PEZI|nr:hypothetical protein, variant [Verruconis gallopava]KIW07444.1 hypothetical protein, variant [Verruconis gallopava]
MSRPAGSSLQFICKQCRHTLRRKIGQDARRFTTTRLLESRALPTFKPTSSPELDGLLSTIRMKYFLPQYLNEHQRKLIRSSKLRSQLENDPVYATFGDEEIRLQHMDIANEMPRKSAFLKAISLFASEDWKNLPSLLEGYHHAKANLDPQWLGLMIQMAREAGVMNIVVQCLAQVERNGLSLGIPTVREQILLGIRQIAREAKWDVEGTKTLRKAEHVLRHMEHPAHCGSRTVSDQDPRAEAYVVAIPLELAARQAIRAGRDERNKVEIYSNRLIAALAQQKSALVCPSEDRESIFFF